LLTYAIGPEELRASLQTIQGLVRRVLGVVAPGDGSARRAA
jgi:hypothetical protein